MGGPEVGDDVVPDGVDAGFRWVIARMPVPMGVHAGGTVVFVNDALADLLGEAPSSLEGRPTTSFVHPGDRDRVAARMARVLAGEQLEASSVRIVTATGAEVPVEVSPMPITFGGAPAVLLAVRDVSRRKEAEDALRASEARWRALVQHGTDLIVVLDRDARFTYVSPSVRPILRREPEDLLGASALDLVHPHDVDAARSALESRVADADRPHEGHRVRLLTGDGEWRWLDTMATNLLGDPDVRGIIVNAWDVTSQVAAEGRLRHLAQHDALTGLPNRTLLADRLDLALHEGRSSGTVTGLLMLDLDRFKDVNDTLGHDSGDEVLATLAARIDAAVREDDVVGRIGGDEFAVVLPDAGDAVTVEGVARRILEVCGEPVLHEGMQLRVGASIGMVLAPDHGDEPSLLLRRVDAAMYRAKEQRLGVAAATDGDLDGGRRRLAAAEDLRLALERGELRCEYQPKVDLATERVVGLEALVRWQHPDRGMVGPDSFLPDAELLGLMPPLTRWVLSEALTHLVAWGAAGLALTVAVNVSATMLHHSDLVTMVDELLAETGADPTLLLLEVTEQAAMVRPEASLAVMGALRERGIGFSIDDFGTGQSSLTYLRRLPVGEVKIDRTFVDGLVDGTPDAAIARSVVDLAHNLGMQAVAEGIETPEALAVVRSFGCDLGQGWLFGRPMSGELVATACGARRTG